MNKLKMHSPNLTQENIARIRELFPGCVTEAQGEDGKVRLAVDFDQLRQELSESIVEGPQERYHLNWPGKREALLTANAPIAKTLRPCREESVDFDTTKNLFIEGDNLEALKLLQETYLGQVKMIYIDPPYNTGNDFIYEDDFAENADEFLKRSNQKDEEGNRLVANTESNGRFHSDWLSMMYPRLKLARNLLSDDGVIFISIDDGEVHSLRKAADEVFGESNFIANAIWEKKFAPQNDAKWLSDNHDHILIYAKDKQIWRPYKLPRTEENNARFNNPDNDPRGVWASSDMTVRTYNASTDYPITTPSGKEIKPTHGRCWAISKEKFQELIKDNRVWFGKNGDNVPRYKTFLSEVDDGIVPLTIWKYGEVGHNQEARQETKNLFENNAYFDSPKPTRLLIRIAKISTKNDDLILDFFAGSATTAHAVMQLNAEDGGNRRSIMVQLPEPCDEQSEAFKSGYKTIAEISKERIRRAGKKILESECHGGWNKDIGFRVLKVDSSNMTDVYYTPDAIEQDQLKTFTDNIKSDRKPEDLLFQVLLDWGVDLSLPIRKESIQGKTVFFVNEPPYDLVACFDTGVNEDLVKELARFEPLRVVFRDTGFVSDAVKINVEQIFKQMSPGTDVKAI
ncbi:MAG: site-specific DNA-methyltransferase [Bacteroidia bacterium]|nr:site-specific DNA-methyltransferase [Bacteroidia bacterium]